MLELKHRDITPPRGWDFLVPDGGPLIEAGDFGELVLKVLDYCVKHGLPTDNLAAIVEDEICRRKPVRCAPPRPAPDGSTRSIGVADVWRFLKTVIEWMKSGGFIDQAEAERRAETCAGCRFNGEVDHGCWGCAGLFSIVESAIGNRTTRMGHALKNCKACACLNSVQVFVPLPVLQKASGNLEYPADTDGKGTPCWKRPSDA